MVRVRHARVYDGRQRRVVDVAALRLRHDVRVEATQLRPEGGGEVGGVREGRAEWTQMGDWHGKSTMAQAPPPQARPPFRTCRTIPS